MRDLDPLGLRPGANRPPPEPVRIRIGPGRRRRAAGRGRAGRPPRRPRRHGAHRHCACDPHPRRRMTLRYSTDMTTTKADPPRAFPLPGYPIVVGPFTHVAAERDRLAALRWRAFDARLLGATVRGGDLGRRPGDRAARRGRRRAAPGAARLQGHLLPGPAPDPGSARRVRPALRRAGDPPLPGRRTPGSPSWCASRRRRRWAATRTRGTTTSPGGSARPWEPSCTRSRSPSRRRHPVLRHVRGLRLAGRGDQGADRRAGRGARLHPDLRARHDGRRAPRRAGEVPAGPPSGGLHAPRPRASGTST